MALNHTGSQGHLHTRVRLSCVSEEVRGLASYAEQLRLESLRALELGCLIKPVSSWGFRKLAKGLHDMYAQTGYGNM